MSIDAQIPKFPQFKEPMTEPEFVLAWDEPEESSTHTALPNLNKAVV
ncbi:MAG TPA: hypothetical protein VIM29_02765 [Bacillota bacterium]